MGNITNNTPELLEEAKREIKNLQWYKIGKILLTKFIPCFITGCMCAKIETVIDILRIAGISLLIATVADVLIDL